MLGLLLPTNHLPLPRVSSSPKAAYSRLENVGAKFPKWKVNKKNTLLNFIKFTSRHGWQINDIHPSLPIPVSLTDITNQLQHPGTQIPFQEAAANQLKTSMWDENSLPTHIWTSGFRQGFSEYFPHVKQKSGDL